MITPPGPEVLGAFGLSGEPRLLTGGRGGTWRIADAVRPVPTLDGSWLFDGWEAAMFVAGQAEPWRVDDVVHAGQAFHQAIAAMPRPSFLDFRDASGRTGTDSRGRNRCRRHLSGPPRSRWRTPWSGTTCRRT